MKTRGQQATCLMVIHVITPGQKQKAAVQAFETRYRIQHAADLQDMDDLTQS